MIYKLRDYQQQASDANTCYQCSHAYLMRSVPHNPIVSECAITHQREVASTLIKCSHFKQRVGNADVKPMIKI